MNDRNTERVDILRQWLGNYDLEADKMLSADLHDREDIPDYWQCGQWSIGLDVSAGTAVLTLRRRCFVDCLTLFYCCQRGVGRLAHCAYC